MYSLELLSLTAGLLPSLILYGGHTHLAKSVLSALQHKLSSLPQPALAMASVQVVLVNFSILCKSISESIFSSALSIWLMELSSCTLLEV